MYWGRGIHYRGCTFIAGGVHTSTHVNWGRGIHYRGCTFIAGGVHTRTHVYWGRGIHYRGCTFIAGGVHTRTHVYWGRGIHYRGCTFIAGGVHTRTHVYWGRSIHYRGCTIKCYESTITFSTQVVKYILVEFFDVCVKTTSCFLVNVTSRANCGVFELGILKFFLSLQSTHFFLSYCWVIRPSCATIFIL